MAREYATKERHQLCGGQFTDMEVAFKTAMLMRGDMDFEPRLAMAKDRIRWLSVQLALAQMDRENLLLAAKITNAAIGDKRIEGFDQNPKGWRDILFSAITQAERTP